jgi:Rrf2 family protein
MQITRQADYAVRAVLYLADHERSARVTTAEIGRDQQIPVTFLAKIVAQLSTAGILRSTRGSHGGVCLAMPPDEISLLDIVEVIDGPIELNECVADRSLCALGDSCPVRSVWCNAQAELVDRLMRTNFGVLAALHHKPEPILEPAQLH